MLINQFKKSVKEIIRYITPQFVIDMYAEPMLNVLYENIKSIKKTYEYMQTAYAQEGEDLIVESLFYDKYDGFFVDVGAYHPKLYSNTYFLYQKGWRGINIDARPESMKLFEEVRPQDINIEAAISTLQEELTYYMFDEPGLNGFSKSLTEERVLGSPYKLIKEIRLFTEPLSEILDKYMPKHQQIDLMSIDVEGLDLEVLQSNNWEKYSPTLILVEILHTLTIDEVMLSPIHLFISQKGYKIIAKTSRTTFYQK